MIATATALHRIASEIGAKAFTTIPNAPIGAIPSKTNSESRGRPSKSAANSTPEP